MFWHAGCPAPASVGQCAGCVMQALQASAIVFAKFTFHVELCFFLLWQHLD